MASPVNGRSIEVQLLRLSEFLTLFYCVAYEDRALVVGYDLPRELTRLASDWREIKRARTSGAGTCPVDLPGRESGERKPSAGWRPRLILKRVTPNVTFIEFTGHRISRYRGEFLDLSNLAQALTGRHWPLVEALKTFAGEEIEEHADGSITPDSIGSVRHHVHAIVSLAKALVGHFDCLHPVSRRRGGHLSETRLFSRPADLRGLISLSSGSRLPPCRKIGSAHAPPPPSAVGGPGARPAPSDTLIVVANTQRCSCFRGYKRFSRPSASNMSRTRRP